jgi:Uma2 family endonuclease
MESRGARVITQTQAVTADDLLELPDDGFRYELVRGELKKMPPAGNEHGYFASEIHWRLAQHVRTHNLGRTYAAETGFKLTSDPDTVRAPDAAFVSRERLEALGPVKGYWPGAPDLAVEVVSPGDTYSEVQGKVFEWLDAGTRLVLVLDQGKRTVTAYRSRTDIVVLGESDTLDGGDVVPGWTLALNDLFA